MIILFTIKYNEKQKLHQDIDASEVNAVENYRTTDSKTSMCVSAYMFVYKCNDTIVCRKNDENFLIYIGSGSANVKPL